MSDLGSRGFGNNLRISIPQVEIFRLSPGIEPGNGKGERRGSEPGNPTEAALDFTIRPTQLRVLPLSGGGLALFLFCH